MGFIDFFRLNFALADCNFINIMKTIFFCVHDMVSSNSNSKFESFTNFWPIRNKGIPTLIWLDHKKPIFRNWWNYAMKIFFVLICPSPMSYRNPPSYVFEALDLVEYMGHMEQQLPAFQRESKPILVEDCTLSILVC